MYVCVCVCVCVCVYTYYRYFYLYIKGIKYSHTIKTKYLYENQIRLYKSRKKPW